MKKLLLIGVAVSGLAFVAGERSDAQVSAAVRGTGGISFGFPGGFYAYPTAYNYYPYGYYMRPYYSYSQSSSYRYGGAYSWYDGRRTNRHTHRHHYHYRHNQP